ncbi:hypothetical protein [Solihabitans fulvus]|uniref:hypothetical protein n=1 Tax=Solihabitans fulvus TaxID=1892852 RepID=UPI001661CC2D|nr:hypothetical protein [Solihabitans fulvus]
MDKLFGFGLTSGPFGLGRVAQRHHRGGTDVDKLLDFGLTGSLLSLGRVAQPHHLGEH